jgi:cytidylate kinase
MSSAEQDPDFDSDMAAEQTGRGESPHHGFRGDHAPAPTLKGVPASLTIAISREAGSRGNTIGNRTGQKLAWPVYNQGLLEYIAQEGPLRQSIADSLSPEAVRWTQEHLEKLLREQNISQHPSVLDLARIVLALGAQGDAVLIGRGAGCILPPQTTLHVRIMAPLEARQAYMSQWLRLTEEEAANQVRLRDTRRAEFITTHFHRQPTDIYQYDLVLNSALLGEEVTAELIAQAARAKLVSLAKPQAAPPPWQAESVG